MTDMASTDKMAKISNYKIICYYFFILIFLFTNSACTSIKILTVINDTSDTVNFIGEFEHKSNKVDLLEFDLKPGDVNSWQYEVSKFDEDQLDRGLKSITLQNNSGCKVSLQRGDIEKIAVKDARWKISINNHIMDCK